MGADRSSCGDDCVMAERADSKLVRVGPALIGCAGSIRAEQLIRYLLEPPKEIPELPADEWIVRRLACPLAALLERERVASRSAEGDLQFAGCFLVAFRGRLWTIQSDFAAIRHAGDSHAIGSGEQPALGALHATRDLEPRERIERALTAAASVSAKVRAPFDVEVLP